MSAKKLLTLLVEDGLVDQATAKGLQQQIAGKKVSAANVANALVKKGLITQYQATKLVGRVTESVEAKREEQAQAKAAGPSDDLGLAEVADELGLADEPAAAAPAADDGDLGLVPDESDDAAPMTLMPDDPADGDSLLEPVGEPEPDATVMLEAVERPAPVEGLMPVEDAGAALKPVGTPAPAGLEPISDGLEPIDAGGLEPMGGGGLEPLDGGLDPIDGGGDDLESAAAAQRKKYAPKETNWGTFVILGVGGFVIFLGIAGFWLWKNLSTEPAIKLLEAADESYRGGNFPDAKNKYAEFVKNYSSNERASHARVRGVLCQLRQVSSANKLMELSGELLPTIEEEKAFADTGRDDLPGILPLIPEGFIDEAKKTDDMALAEQLSEKAKEGMVKFVENPVYILPSKLKGIKEQIDRIRENIQLVDRAVVQDKELNVAIAAIGTHVEASEPGEAYAVYTELTNKYPVLSENESLQQAVLSITEGQRALVRVAEETLTAVTEDVPKTTEFRVVLATRSANAAARVINQVVPVLAGGSVYGLDAGNGTVIWRRFVGHSTQFHPRPVSDQPNADILFVDGSRNELVRVESATGALKWRLPMTEKFAAPTVAGDRIFVANESGTILELDANGNSSRNVIVPQSVAVGPGVAQSFPYLFQAGDHTNLYVLSSNTLACDEVVYLGHERGTVAVPPVVLQGHVFVVVNPAPDHALVHVWRISTEEEGPILRRLQKPFRLEGNVINPPIVYGHRLMLVTDRNQIEVYNIDVNKEEESVEIAARGNASREEPMRSYPLAVPGAGTLWLADEQLAKYSVQVTTKNINRQGVSNNNDVFVGPLQLMGGKLIHIRRLAGSTGVTVAGVDANNPRTTVWQTHLGVPASRVVTQPSLRAISAGASLFDITGQAIQRGYNDVPTATALAAGGTLAFTDEIEMGDGKAAFFNPTDNRSVLIYDSSSARRPLRMLQLKLPNVPVACVPIAFQQGLLVPTEDGRVHLLDLGTGDKVVLPFQPTLSPGAVLKWRRPVAVGDGTEFVIADDQQQIYKIASKTEPTPFLSQAAAGSLPYPISSDLAVSGASVFAAGRAPGADAVVAINVADLAVAKEFPLKGRVTWGPVAVGEAVFFRSDQDGLLCFEHTADGPQQRWAVPTTHEPIGRPLQDGNDFIFASVSGTVWRVAGQTGQEQQASEIGEPLGCGPVSFGPRLLLCGNDGALHVIPMLAAGG